GAGERAGTRRAGLIWTRRACGDECGTIGAAQRTVWAAHHRPGRGRVDRRRGVGPPRASGTRARAPPAARPPCRARCLSLPAYARERCGASMGREDDRLHLLYELTRRLATFTDLDDL